MPVVTDIVNESLSTGVFPTCLKHSLIRPLLKKQDLDRENLKNYRSIANIPFLSKVIEKAVVVQMNLYLETNKLIPLLQSAYRKHYFTETALLRVLDGILMSPDHREDVVLVMLDLSAAFDTLDHEILKSRLGSYFRFLQHCTTVLFILLKWAHAVCHHRESYIESSPCRLSCSPMVNLWTSSF